MHINQQMEAKNSQVNFCQKVVMFWLCLFDFQIVYPVVVIVIVTDKLIRIAYFQNKGVVTGTQNIELKLLIVSDHVAFLIVCTMKHLKILLMFC